MMRSGCPRLLIKRATWLVVLLAAGSIAAAAQGIEAPATTETVFRWLNFALVFGLGGWWGWRKLKGAFQRKADRIAETIAEAEAARREAQARLSAAEEKLAALDRESAEMRERASLDSAAETARIRELALEESGRIDHASEAEIKAAELAAVNRLREMTINMTIESARAQVTKRITPEIDARLVSSFVDALGRAGGSL